MFAMWQQQLISQLDQGPHKKSCGPLLLKPGSCSAALARRLAVPFPIGGDDLVELQNTVYRVFNQSAIILPGSLLGNDSSLQAATQKAVGGCAAARHAFLRKPFLLITASGCHT